jgi:hypothetical protein
MRACEARAADAAIVRGVARSESCDCERCRGLQKRWGSEVAARVRSIEQRLRVAGFVTAVDWALCRLPAVQALHSRLNVTHSLAPEPSPRMHARSLPVDPHLTCDTLLSAVGKAA